MARKMLHMINLYITTATTTHPETREKIENAREGPTSMTRTSHGLPNRLPSVIHARITRAPASRLFAGRAPSCPSGCSGVVGGFGLNNGY